MKSVALIIGIFLLVQAVNAQNLEDSLRLEYTKTNADTARIRILHQLFELSNNRAPEEAKRFILEALDLSENNDYLELQVASLNRYADFLRTQSQDDSALVVNTKSLRLSRKIAFLEGQSKALLGLGSSYARTGGFDEANKYLEQSLKIASERNDSLSIADSYMVLGAMHTQKVEYTEAMDLMTRASLIYQNLGEKRKLSRALGNIGFVHRNLGNFKKAESYYMDSDILASQLNFTSQQAFNAYNLSIIYRKLGQLDRAITSNQKAIDIYDKLGDQKRVSFGYFTMGKIHWEKESFETALNYYKQSLAISENVRDSVN
ncbi:MAG: tetratricopeptide repeat protein, partial [Flavobacteriaceae bacterium]